MQWWISNRTQNLQNPSTWLCWREQHRAPQYTCGDLSLLHSLIVMVRLSLSCCRYLLVWINTLNWSPVKIFENTGRLQLMSCTFILFLTILFIQRHPSCCFETNLGVAEHKSTTRWYVYFFRSNRENSVCISCCIMMSFLNLYCIVHCTCFATQNLGEPFLENLWNYMEKWWKCGVKVRVTLVFMTQRS